MASGPHELALVEATSHEPVTRRALAEVIETIASRRLETIDLVVVQASSDHRLHFGAIDMALRRRLGARQVYGACVEAVIGGGVEHEARPGLAVLAARLPRVGIHPLRAEVDWGGALDSLHEVAPGVGGDTRPPRMIFIMADPFSTPTEQVLGALARLAPGVPVVGGVTGVAERAGENRLLASAEVRRKGVVGFVMTGAVDVRCLVSSSARPVGGPKVITGSRRHVVQQLGGRPAIEVLDELVEGMDAGDRDIAENGGLLVGRVIDEYKSRFGRGDFLMRNILGVDREAGYLAVADPQVRVGQTLQFQLVDETTARRDLALLLDAERLHGPAAGALLFHCHTRSTQFFGAPHADAGSVHEALGASPMIGGVVAAELGPVGGRSFVHFHAASLAVFRPPPAPGPA